MFVLSLVHVRNLHSGANLNPGCIFGHVNGVLRICTSNSRGGANCAHERKIFNFYTF